MEPLQVDPAREYLEETGVYVSAMRSGNRVSADIAHLSRDSLLHWLRLDAGNGETKAVWLALRWLGWE